MISSQANRRARLHGRCTRLTTPQVPMLHGHKTCPANIDSVSLIRWFTIVRPQTLRLPTIRLAAITSPTPMAIRCICLNLMARTPMPTGEFGLSLMQN
jgi:hypothetical protein